MKAIALAFVLCGVAVGGSALARDDAPEGWIAKLVHAAGNDEEGAYTRGYEFGEDNAAMLAAAWRVHDEMLRESIGSGLGRIARRVARLAADELSDETIKEMEGIDDGLDDAGVSLSTEEIVGWNTFMDLSLHWAPKIRDGFNAARSGRLVGVGGALYRTENANKPHSLTAPEPNVLRFEVASGDRWRPDSPRNERTEIAGPVYPAGETLTVTYDLMIEPGSPNEADWLVHGQFHADDTETTPPFAIELVGDRMIIRIRHRRDDKRGVAQLYRDSEDLERGRYYRMKIMIHFPTDTDDDGWVAVWRDGEQIVDYEGPLGYGYGVYWKIGIYRQQTWETFAVKVRDLFVTSDDGMIVLSRADRDAVD